MKENKKANNHKMYEIVENISAEYVNARFFKSPHAYVQ